MPARESSSTQEKLLAVLPQMAVGDPDQQDVFIGQEEGDLGDAQELYDLQDEGVPSKAAAPAQIAFLVLDCAPVSAC